MAARGLLWALCLQLTVICVLCGRAQQQQSQERGRPEQPTVLHSSYDCEALLLSSLSTFVTSGSGYAYEAPPKLPQLSGQGLSSRAATTNRSGTVGSNPTLAPTPPHKPLWPDWSTRDIWLFSLAAITLFIAAGGGIGGGAVFVPLYIIIGGFTPAQSVALSNITILGGAVANFIANSTKRHAFRDAPLIDWDLIMVMEPTTMLGALLGSYTNKLFPTWFTSCLMAALLVLLTWKLLRRGIATFIRETNENVLARRQQQQLVSDDITAPLLTHAHDQDAAAYADADTLLAGADGFDSSSKHTAVVDGMSAWMDAGTAADQSPTRAGRRSSSNGGSARQSQHSSDDDLTPSAAVDVLPVPPGLRPLLTPVMLLSPNAVAPAVEATLQRETPRSARAFSVEGTPTKVPEHRASSDTGPTSPILWPHSNSATAAAEADALGPRCPYVHGAHQKAHHQQRRRQALLLPRHSGDDSSSNAAGGSKQPSRAYCCPCSCFDPARLSLSTVQAYARQQLPWQPLLTLFCLASWVVASDTGKATLACGSLRYWAVVLSVVPPCVLVTLAVRQWLLARSVVEAAAAAAAVGNGPAGQTGAQQQQQQYKAGNIHWTPRNSITYPLVCSIAGVFAGLFGVGGGIVKGPLMLELGVLPDVAAATSATMIMFTAGSAAIVYVNFGGVVRDYAQALLLLGFVVTLAGQLVAAHLVRVLKRRSIIIFAMGLLMLLASIAAVYQMGSSTVMAFQHPPVWVWGSICQHR